MGNHSRATCLDCTHEFGVDDGGGFTFHLLRCDQCGTTTSVLFEQILDLHGRYLKSSGGVWSIGTAAADTHLRDQTAGDPLPREEYEHAVEQHAGTCPCGGQFRFNAEPRCPACRSQRLDIEAPFIFYD